MEVKAGYKQTEVGVIPEDWFEGELADFNPFITSGSRGYAKYYSEKGAPFIRITNLLRESINLDLTDLKFVDLPIGVSDSERTQLQTNDVLISITADIGIIGHVTDSVEKPAYMNQHIALVRFNPDKAKSQFISYFLASESAQKNFRESKDQGAKAGMNLMTIRKIRIPRPPLPEQHAIATALSDADAHMSSLEQVIAKKRDIKQAAMQDLLSGKRRLPGFNDEWSRSSLTGVCWFQEGPGVRNYQFTQTGVKLLNGTNIFRGEISLDNTDRYISMNEAFGPYSHFLAQVGDIVIASSGISIDKFHEKVAIVHENHLPLCMNTSTIRFRAFDNKLNSKFLYYFLVSDSFKNQISIEATGSAQLNFGPSHVAKVVIWLPKLEEQHAIATVLSDMDSELTALKKQRNKTKAIKQGMMQELLTGRIRLV